MKTTTIWDENRNRGIMDAVAAITELRICRRKWKLRKNRCKTDSELVACGLVLTEEGYLVRTTSLN